MPFNSFVFISKGVFEGVGSYHDSGIYTTTRYKKPRQEGSTSSAYHVHTLFNSIDDLFIPLPLIATNQTKFATNRH